MSFLNVEIKARCADPDHIREYLVANNADFKGVDEQTDTYFNVPAGRLKLREGNIENNLIFYHRPDQAGPKNSNFNLVPIAHGEQTKALLTAALGVKVVVKKRREIFYLDNVKLHLDTVPSLGSFVEIEAGNMIGGRSQEELSEQCHFYLRAFNIAEADLIEVSYSDMLLGRG